MDLLRRSKKHKKTIKLIDYLVKEVRKTTEWKHRVRWIRVYKVVSTIDYLLINNNVSKFEMDILMKLQYEVKQIAYKMKSNVMPLKAFKVMTKAIKMSLKAV